MNKATAAWALLVMYLGAGALSIYVATTEHGWWEHIDALLGGWWLYLALRLLRKAAEEDE
jgi:hypothetical protein